MPEVTINSPDALKNFPSSPDAGKTSVLTVKSIALDPAALLACLKKCAESLEVLHLEKVSLPKTPNFKRIALPKLKTFYLYQAKAGVDKKEQLESYLDELNVMDLLFFDKKAKSWELEEIWELKTNVTLIVDGWKLLDINYDDLTLACMLPQGQGDVIVSNAPKELTKLALYDLEIESETPIPTSELTHLTLYEVIFPDIPAVLKQCTQLEALSLYEEKDDDGADAKGGKGKGKEEDDEDDDYDDEEGEEEEEDGDVDDWNTIELADLPAKTLKHLALGRARLSAKAKGATTFDLDVLGLENCKTDPESLKLLKSKRVLMRGCDPPPTASVLKRMTDVSSTEFVMMNGFNWEAKDTNKKKMNELLKASSSSGELYSGEDKFLLEKAGGPKWKGRKFEEDECLEQQFKLFAWDQFCTEETWKNMFN